MQTAGAVFVVGVLAILAIVVGQDLIVSQTTTSWDSTVATIFPILGILIAVVGVVALAKLMLFR